MSKPTRRTSMTALDRIKRIVVMVVGGTVLAIGVALILLPGPAFIVIPAGLGILAMEFAWARRWLHRARGILTGGEKLKAETPAKAPCQRQTKQT